MIYSESDRIASSMERKRKINKIITIIITGLLIFMVLFSLLLISLELGNSKELPSFLNMNLYIVTSTSMEPRLNVDDVIIVKKGYTNEEYKVRKHHYIFKARWRDSNTQNKKSCFKWVEEFLYYSRW